MTTIIKELELLGLSEKESLVFQVLLERGRLSVSEIAKELKLKRPTLYSYLETLKNNGLVNEEIFKGKRFYRPVSRPTLTKIIKSKAEGLKKLPDIIKQLSFSKPSALSGVSVYHGKKGVLALGSEIASYEGEVFYLGSLEGISHIVGERYYEEFYNKTRRKKLGTDYMISDFTKMTVRYFHKESGMFTKRRFLPTDLKVDGCFVIFGDKLVVAQYKPEIIAYLLEDKGLTEIFKLSYLSLWKDLEGKNTPT